MSVTVHRYFRTGASTWPWAVEDLRTMTVYRCQTKKQADELRLALVRAAVQEGQPTKRRKKRDDASVR